MPPQNRDPITLARIQLNLDLQYAPTAKHHRYFGVRIHPQARLSVTSCGFDQIVVGIVGSCTQCLAFYDDEWGGVQPSVGGWAGSEGKAFDICQIIPYTSACWACRGDVLESARMPKETDPARLALLLRLLTDGASNVVLFQPRALLGSSEPDDVGLDKLLPQHLRPRDKEEELKRALTEFLRGDGQPNRVAVAGDADRGDPAVFYEFRLPFAGLKAYIKTELNEDNPKDPVLIVKSIKRQN